MIMTLFVIISIIGSDSITIRKNHSFISFFRKTINNQTKLKFYYAPPEIK